MANEFIARKGLIALENSQITGSLNISGDADIDGTLEADAITVNGTALSSVIAGTTVANAVNSTNVNVVATTDNADFFVTMVDGASSDQRVESSTKLKFNPSNGNFFIEGNITASGAISASGVLSIPGFTNVSASLAAAVAGGDDLGNHTATQDLNMGGNNITSVGNVDGVDVSALNTSVSTNTTNITTLTAATSSYLTSVPDGTLSGSAQIATEISGAFTAASASFSTRVTANDAKLTANTSNVTSAGALMDSEVTNLAQVKAFDSSDYATAAQGTKADTAIQPADTGSFLTTVDISSNTNLAAGTGITLTGDTLSTNDSEIDHDSLSNFSADEHFTQANITTVGTITSGDVSAILPTGTVSGSSQISDLGFVNNSQSARITFLYTSSTDGSPTVPSGYIHYSDSALDRIIISTSSYNGVDLDASVSNDYSKFQYGEAGSLLTIRKLSDGSFKTYKVTTVTTDIFSISGQVGYLVDGGSFTIVVESGSISNGDEVEFIWDKSAGVGGAYGPTEGTLTKTFAGIFQPDYNYLDMFFGTATDTELDGSPENLSGVESSASFTDIKYFLPAISQSESLTLGGLTVNGTITGNINTSSITNFPTEVSRSAAAAGFGSGGGGGGGNVSNTGTPTNNQVAVWTDATTIEGTDGLTYDGTTLDIDGVNAGSGVRIYGGIIGSANPYISPVGGHSTLNFGDASTGNILSMQNNKISFDSDATNTYIQANTDVPEDLEIHADQDIILAADNAVVIGAVTDVEDRISSYRTQIVSNGFYAQNSLRYITFNTTGETTGFNYLSLMPAPANGRLISISAWPQSSGGSTVIGLHINSNATAATTDTQTLTAGTPVTFTFSSNNTFSQNDEISFSVNPTNTPNGLFFSIILEYDY